MEQVDEIILLSLNQIGLEIPDVSSITEEVFTSDLVIYITASCMNLIDKSLKIPLKFSNEMSQRFRACTNLSKTIKDHGYQKQISYSFFLYPNVDQMRDLFLWMVELLPKQEDEEVMATTGVSILRQIKISIFEWSESKEKTILKPKISTVRLVTPLSFDLQKNSKSKRYCQRLLPLISSQTRRISLSDSVIETNDIGCVLKREEENEWNNEVLDSGLSLQEFQLRKKKKAMGIVSKALQSSITQMNQKYSLSSFFEQERQNNFKNKMFQGSRFANLAKYGLDRKDKFKFSENERPKNEKENIENKEKEKAKTGPIIEEMDPEKMMQKLKEKHQEEVSEIQTKIKDYTDKTAQIENETRNYLDMLIRFEKQLEEMNKTIEDLEKEYQVRKRIQDFLPNHEENIQILQQNIQSSQSKILNLAGQWEKHRLQLLEKYRNRKKLASSQNEMWKGRLEEIKELREDSKTLSQTIQQRNTFYTQLLTEFKKLPKKSYRTNYTKQIFDIVKNVKKQKGDIDKVLLETHDLRKEINRLNGALSRSHLLADEMIYPMAEKDDLGTGAKQVYFLFDKMHKLFETIIQDIQQRGKTSNEIRNLEIEVDNLKRKDATTSLKKISKDLSQMQSGNTELQNQLKKLKKSKDSKK
ncbi:jm1 protein [Anaeramoeba ignava]|uniref:Jm1 protein n=1 Tax=Anaeramoeba ignava TaxID=1746090 RepID=A0A9Q0R8I9_ANAIG|nr:jm1 protein [Anaeramoeba ignava]